MKQEDLQLFEKVIEQNSVRLGCSLVCHLSFMDKNISSMEQRKQLRVELVEEINKKWPDKLSREQCDSLLVPGKLPQISFVSISIAHSADMGGFIFTSSPFFIGFDLEQQGRAKERTVFRISQKEELEQSPSPSALWSAKESTYKAVSLLKNDIYIKKISILNWQISSLEDCKSPTTDRELEIYDYQFKVEDKDHFGKGCICFVKDTVMGFAFLT